MSTQNVLSDHLQSLVQVKHVQQDVRILGQLAGSRKFKTFFVSCVFPNKAWYAIELINLLESVQITNTFLVYYGSVC